MDLTPVSSTLSAKINAIKGHTLSQDKSELAIVLDAKHVGDLSIIMSVELLDQLASILNRARTEIPAKGGENQLKINAPKNWLVAADLQVHNIVLLIFNRQSDAQTGYALDANAAKQMAEGLIKNANAVLQKKAQNKNGPGQSS